MDRSWVRLSRDHSRYFDGIRSFIEFIEQNNPPDRKYKCPCKSCRLQKENLTVSQIRAHLIHNGMMRDYTVWTLHGEVSNVPSAYERRQRYIRAQQESMRPTGSRNPIMEMLDDAHPYRDRYEANVVENMDESVDIDHVAKAAYEKYNKLVEDAQTPVYDGSKETVLGAILKAMQLKVQNRWSDKSFNDMLKLTKDLLPSENKYPDSYRAVKKILKNMGLGYEVIHACEYGCALFYKDYENLDKCPICDEPRYVYSEGKDRTPKRVVRYFPLTPRLQRLYMSPYTAKEMRWHGERLANEGYLRHPADGKAWQDFEKQFPEFGKEVRNVRLGLATDGFNPFGATSISHSTWPIVVMPYNFPPSMCMKKEFNILVMLISGPKSPGKCLNVFMEPLIDELKVLWETGVATFDRHDKSTFLMKAAVMWTISDFPGLGMLGGLKTKGYKACPLCLDEVHAEHLTGRMTYQGHRRWLDHNHQWRKDAHKFNGLVELRDAPHCLSGDELLAEILRHEYPVQSLHPKFKPRSNAEKLCWTHKSTFYELPYWKTLRHQYSLDVMHIEKNVFDNIIGTILGLEGKTKDDHKAREGLKKQGVRKNLWTDNTASVSSKKDKVSQAPYTVVPQQKNEIFEWLKDAKYPYGYAGSLKNKINVEDKKFYGLKTHDCHVMLQRLLPVVIRPYLPPYVVEPLIALFRWFQKLCARELKNEDVHQMKKDIVMILCKLERIFPPAFFTIMVHLMIHLPDQTLLTGPVHFNWMFPIERQLGEYKRFVRNNRFPEGCIAEQYVAQECVTYCNLYIGDSNTPTETTPEGASRFNISVVSELIKPDGPNESMKLNKEQLDRAHWCVMEHCTEAEFIIKEHESDTQITNEGDQMKSFNTFFLNSINKLRDTKSPQYKLELWILAHRPQSHMFYSHCYVNGVKYVIWEKDRNLKTQNSGVMVESCGMSYYGILEAVIQLNYTKGMPVVLFKCKWFDNNPKERGNTKLDHGLLSVDTSTSWFEESPYILAATARQVFYLDDPKAGDSWKVVNVMSQRGTYNHSALERDRSLIAHDIGSQVKTSVPMMGSNFDEVKKKYPDDVQKMYTYLEAHFDLPEANNQLWKFIKKIATKRFKEWKHDCRAHWEQFGDEIPFEFLERPDQWDWLCNHFKDPKQQELSARMKWVRAQKKMNHHSGKLPFSYRAEEHLLKNNPAPFVASFSDAYSRDPVARPYVDQMIEKVFTMVEERLVEHPEIPVDAPLDTAKQVGVIESVVGERRGSEIRGMGDSMRRQPRPRGGPTHMPYVANLEEKIAAQEEKIAAQEEKLIAQDEEKNEMKSRIAYLEEKFGLFFAGGQ